MFRSLSHPVETFRTAPAQFAGAAGGSALAYAFSLPETDTVPLDALRWGLIAGSLGAAAACGILVKGRVELRDRIESILERRGFSDRVMSHTTQTYCGRQAARVACRNYGYLDDYEALCEGNSKNAQLTWLPHI
jgi:hypothetical protein